MAAKKYDFQGKHLTTKELSKVSGVAETTIIDRLKLGWTAEQAALTAPDTAQNRIGLGKAIHTGILSSLKKVWDASGREAFEKQLAVAFDKDAIKTTLAFKEYLPRIVETSEEHKPVTAIQVNNLIDPKDFQFLKPVGG